MSTLLSRANTIIDHRELNIRAKLLKICELLRQHNPHYTWVGFYFMEDARQRLHLGPFVGEDTDHKEIPYGKGICGQVAETGTTYLAKDVNSESNYIACSVDVRSEIVVPVYDAESLVAQLDIDSDKADAFSKEDRQLLEDLCDRIGAQLGPDMHWEG